MRPVDKSAYTANSLTYNPYGDAKPDLIAALGHYCTYCERNSYSAALEVEHVKDKDAYKQFKYDWDNFLLACKNCNTIKGRKDVDVIYDLLPHLKDTFSPIQYGGSGFVSVKNGIDNTLAAKALDLIELVGIDRTPGHPNYSTKDDRWEYRKETWEIANRYKKNFIENNIQVSTIIDLAKSYGFWSIWMSVFCEIQEVRNELLNLNNFKGTRLALF